MLGCNRDEPPPVPAEEPPPDAVPEAALLAREPIAFWIPCEANMPGLNRGFSVVAGGPKNDWTACRAKLPEFELAGEPLPLANAD